MADGAEQRNGAVVDLLVVGGGVNGAGIARDAVGRGLSVLLCEKGDLAEGTSSRSGKLVHGGLRYLEYYEFRLVREALIEREVLLEAAPHIIWPMRFVLPHDGGLRPAWLLRLGLALYDHLGGRKRLPASRGLDLHRAPEGKPLQDRFRRGFEYSDCWVDDARLVVLNAIGAAERGAEILTRTECVSLRRRDGLWHAVLRPAGGGAERPVVARAVANAAGPWVDRVLTGAAGLKSGKKIRLVRGSHIVVPKFYDGPQAYLVQNTDKRVIFINPYEHGYLLIGTTDIPQTGDPDRVAVDPAEVEYLCGVLNRTFQRQIGPQDVVHSFAGVRPLFDDDAANPSAVTRDYVFDVDDDGGRAPILSVFGGKITTFRKLAEHALDRLKPFFPAMGPAWTAAVPLPGGDMPGADFDRWLAEFRRRHPWLPEDLALHYGRLYGTRADTLLDGARSLADLGRHFGGLLYEREAAWLRVQEWAEDAEDILWRRTKHGLHLSPAETAAFTEWLEAAPAPAAQAAGR
ncbi:glycerol-3-phosphate dehydrogenase [Inquilinus sp. CA228]|uniref:glycerol-3-phosphate dehydrogenase n=1 Tax=Inquilinus sp. CA228 TaxID=3455609 RepID=UPI003F8D2E58